MNRNVPPGCYCQIRGKRGSRASPHFLTKLSLPSFKTQIAYIWTLPPLREDCPEIREFSAELGHARNPGYGTRNMREDCQSGICSPVSRMFNIIMFCVLLVVLFLWWYPSHGTGSREGAFNQQER